MQRLEQLRGCDAQLPRQIGWDFAACFCSSIRPPASPFGVDPPIGNGVEMHYGAPTLKPPVVCIVRGRPHASLDLKVVGSEVYIRKEGGGLLLDPPVGAIVDGRPLLQELRHLGGGGLEEAGGWWLYVCRLSQSASGKTHIWSEHVRRVGAYVGGGFEGASLPPFPLVVRLTGFPSGSLECAPHAGVDVTYDHYKLVRPDEISRPSRCSHNGVLRAVGAGELDDLHLEHGQDDHMQVYRLRAGPHRSPLPWSNSYN
jgi:hypothetical protein